MTGPVEIKDPSEINQVEDFFDKKWNNGIENARYPIIVLSIIWAGITFYYAPQMGPQTE